MARPRAVHGIGKRDLVHLARLDVHHVDPREPFAPFGQHDEVLERVDVLESRVFAVRDDVGPVLTFGVDCGRGNQFEVARVAVGVGEAVDVAVAVGEAVGVGVGVGPPDGDTRTK